METLSNSILTVQIAEHGAELQSIKKDGKEYLWQGDAKFWGRRSPVLFPIVGRVLVSFLFGAMVFREKNLKSKAVDLALVLIGMIFLYLGSR
jgi:hypothetical protein